MEIIEGHYCFLFILKRSNKDLDALSNFRASNRNYEKVGHARNYTNQNKMMEQALTINLLHPRRANPSTTPTTAKTTLAKHNQKTPHTLSPPNIPG